MVSYVKSLIWPMTSADKLQPATIPSPPKAADEEVKQNLHESSISYEKWLPPSASQKSPKEIHLPESIRKSLQQLNIFSSQAEKETLLGMASLAQLMTVEIEQAPSLFKQVDTLFPKSLSMLPNPENLKIALPKGLKVEAYQHGDQIIIGICTSPPDKDLGPMSKHLFSDLAIGSHKSDDELINAVEYANIISEKRYDYKISDDLIKKTKALITSRAKRVNSLTHAMHIIYNVGDGAINGAMNGWRLGTAMASVPATIIEASRFGPPLIGMAVSTCSATAGALTGAAVGTITATVKSFMLPDGYPNLLANVKAIHAYVMKLKDDSYITKDCETITLGHSIGGYLAAIIGAMHADKIYAFNAPGVLLADEAKKICADLGLKPAVSAYPAYHSISMDADFIGNLGKRSGSFKTLYFPTAADSCPNQMELAAKKTASAAAFGLYDSPIAHHGLDLLKIVLENSTVVSDKSPSR